LEFDISNIAINCQAHFHYFVNKAAPEKQAFTFGDADKSACAGLRPSVVWVRAGVNSKEVA